MVLQPYKGMYLQLFNPVLDTGNMLVLQYLYELHRYVLNAS